MNVSSYIKRRPVLVSIMFFLVLVGTIFSIKIRTSMALVGFGGQVMSVTLCTCSLPGSVALTVGTPTPGVYLYTPTTVLFDHYNFWGTGAWLGYVYTHFVPGPWVLGTYIPGGVCLIPTVPDCTPLPYITGTIEKMGTSLLPI